MAEEKGFSFGDASFTAQSRNGWYGMSKEGAGLPTPIFKHNREDIAVILYHHFENFHVETTTLVGFLPYPQAMGIVQAKNGETFWSIVMVVPSLDIERDLRLLWAHLGDCYKGLRHVYKLEKAGFSFLMNWAYKAYQNIDMKGANQQIPLLENERDLFKARNEQLVTAKEDLLKKIAKLEVANQLAMQQADEYRAEIDALKRKLTPKDLSGYVYLLKMVNGEYFKIGRTKDPKDRLKTFNVKLPFEVEYEHVILCADMYALEAELHAKFRDKRVNGEWFALDAADVAYVKGIGGE